MERIKERMCEDRTRTMIGDNGHQVRECLRTNELDHIIPLCLDGAPLDPANLQLQPWSDARKKDERERNACRLYCRGEVDMPAALQIVRGND
jgi:hypothetical protein